MTFIKSETNPNAAVGGGCIGVGGVKGFDCTGPFYTAEAVVGLNATSPKIVVCEHHRGELNRIAAKDQIVPAGYMAAEAQASERALTERPDRVEPKPAAKRKPRPTGELSL